MSARCQHGARIPRGAAQRPPDVPGQLLQHEAADAGAGVDGGQDEQRLEHDGEVIPERHQPAAECAAEDVRHAHRERRRAAGAAEQRLLAHRRGKRLDLLGRDCESPAPDYLAAA